MSRWTDPEFRRYLAVSGQRGRPARALRALKRLEAEERNAKTPYLRRRSARRAGAS